MRKIISSSHKIFFIAFIAGNLLLSSFFLDIQQRWNSTSRMLTVISVCHYGTLKIDRFHERTGDKCLVDGHYYSEKAPLPALTVIPFYFLVKSTGDLENDKDGRIGKRAYIVGNIICGVVPFVFILSVLFLKLLKAKSRFSPFLLATLPFYGSFVFLYTGAFMNHLFGAALLLCAYLFLHDKKKFFLSGIFAGLAFLSDFPLGIILPLWALQVYFNQRSVKNSMEFILGFLPSLLFLFAYNYFITGNPFSMLYRFVSNEDFIQARNTLGFSSIHISALWKMLFSEYRGIFLYFPILILLAFFSIKHFQINWKAISGNYLFLFACIHYLIISSHEIWWGGACVGPRHLIPVTILLAFEGIRILASGGFPKWLFFTLSLAGIIFTWITKSTVAYRIPDELEHPFRDGIFPLFFEKNFNADNVLTMWGDIQPQISAYAWLALFILFTTGMNHWLKKSKKNQTLSDS